jgi:hypothetical protein
VDRALFAQLREQSQRRPVVPVLTIGDEDLVEVLDRAAHLSSSSDMIARNAIVPP